MPNWNVNKNEKINQQAWFILTSLLYENRAVKYIKGLRLTCVQGYRKNFVTLGFETKNALKLRFLIVFNIISDSEDPCAILTIYDTEPKTHCPCTETKDIRHKW